MAMTTGTAATPEALLAAIITFITTNSALVASNQDWEVVRTVAGAGSDGNDHLIRGPGASNTDNIYGRIALVRSGSNVGFSLNVFDTYLSTNLNSNQPNICPVCAVPLWDNSMDYYLYVNGRRIVFVVNVNGRFFGFYMGFYNAYATEAEFPYPICLMAARANSEGDQYAHSANSTFGNFSYIGYVRHVDGSWRSCPGDANVWPHYRAASAASSWSGNDIGYVPGNSGIPLTPGGSDIVIGGLPLIPMHASLGYTYGELDGVIFVKGHLVSTLDTAVINSVTYRIFQGAELIGPLNFCAVMEA